MVPVLCLVEKSLGHMTFYSHTFLWSFSQANYLHIQKKKKSPFYVSPLPIGEAVVFFGVLFFQTARYMNLLYQVEVWEN